MKNRFTALDDEEGDNSMEVTEDPSDDSPRSPPGSPRGRQGKNVGKLDNVRPPR